MNYFCYERNHAMVWIPKLYYDESPAETNPITKEFQWKRSTIHEIPETFPHMTLDDCIKLYPAPKSEAP